MASTDTEGTTRDTGESTSSSSKSLKSIDGPSDAPSEDCPSPSSDSQKSSSTPINPIASTAPISVRRLLRSILSKGSSGLAREFEDTKRDVGKDQWHSKFRLVNESIWTKAWTEKADFIMHMDNERGSEAMHVGKVLDFEELSVECTFYHTVAPFVFLKHKIVEKSTGQSHEVRFIRWKGRDPMCLRRLTILIDNLRLSGRAVLTTSAMKEDGRAGTFALAAMAIEKLRGGNSLKRGLKPLLRNLGNKADMNCRQYVFVHRFILEYFKAEIDEKEITEFRTDHSFFHNYTMNVFSCSFGKSTRDYYRSLKDHWMIDSAEFACGCHLWSEIPCVERPMDGPTVVSLIADFSIKNKELVVECRKGDCMDADFIPLKKIIAKFHELGRDIILIVMGEGPAEFDLAHISTSRVAVIAAIKIENDDVEMSKFYNCDYIRQGILQELERNWFPNQREAMKAIADKGRLFVGCSTDLSATTKVDMHGDWMTRRDESIGRVESAQEDQPPIIPSNTEFRKLLESIQSPDAEQRLDAESKWRRIPGEEKKELLLKVCKSKNKQVRRLAFERLNMLFNCISRHWGEKELDQFTKKIFAAALNEKTKNVGEKIAPVLAHVANRAKLYERTECDLLKFVLGRNESDSPVVKTIALRVAAEVPILGMHECSECENVERRGWGNRFKEFFETMIEDESVRLKAIENWTRFLCNYRKDSSLILHEFDDTFQKIIKMCEGNLSTEKGAPLWSLIHLAPVVDLTKEYGPDLSITIVKWFLEAASNESNEEALEPIVVAISHVTDGCAPSIWIEIVKLVHRCCTTNNNSLKKVALDIFYRHQSYDFGDEAEFCTRIIMESIEMSFWEVPKKRRYEAFHHVARPPFTDPPMECIDRVYQLFIQAVKDDKQLRVLFHLMHVVPKLTQTHFDAVMDAFRGHAVDGDYSRYMLCNIMKYGPGQIECFNAKCLKKYMNDSNELIREAAWYATEKLIFVIRSAPSTISNEKLAQLSFYVAYLIQKFHDNTKEEDNGSSLCLVFGAASLPRVMVAPHEEEIYNIAIANVKTLNGSVMNVALWAFPRLLALAGRKGGSEAIRNLWLVQWNAIKGMIEENTKNKFAAYMIEDITECLLIAREGMKDDEMKKIIWEIKDQLDEVMSRTKKAREGGQRQRRWSEHDTTLCAIKIGSNLIQLDPDFAFNHYHQSITRHLDESLNEPFPPHKDEAIAAFASMAKSNHTEWKGIAVEALKPLSALVSERKVYPVGVKENPIWTVMMIVEKCGDTIGSKKIRMVLDTFLSWLHDLKDVKEGHDVFASLAGFVDVIVTMKWLKWNYMRRLLVTFRPLLELAGKRGPEAIRSLWAGQWIVLKRVIEKNSNKELDSIVIETVTDCLLVVGRKALTEDQLNEIGSLIKDKVEEILTITEEWKECAKTCWGPTPMRAIEIASNLIKFDLDFALRHHKLITHLLSQSLDDDHFERQDLAVNTYAILAESNHAEWKEVAVEAIEQLCALAVSCRATLENIDWHKNPIWALMKIFKNYGDSIGSDKIHMVLASCLATLPHLEEEEEAHDVYAFLADLIEANHDKLLGEPNENGPELLSSLLRAIHGDRFFTSKELCDKAVKLRLVAIVEKMRVSGHFTEEFKNWRLKREEDKKANDWSSAREESTIDDSMNESPSTESLTPRPSPLDPHPIGAV